MIELFLKQSRNDSAVIAAWIPQPVKDMCAILMVCLRLSVTLVMENL